MAQSFDGDIRLSVGIDPRQVTEVINQLGKNVSNIFSSANGTINETNKAVTNLGKSVDTTSKNIKSLDNGKTGNALSNSLDRIKEKAKNVGSSMSEAFSNATDKASAKQMRYELQVQKAKDRLDELYRKQAELADQKVYSDEYKQLEKDLSKAISQVEKLKGKISTAESGSLGYESQLSQLEDEIQKRKELIAIAKEQRAVETNPQKIAAFNKYIQNVELEIFSLQKEFDAIFNKNIGSVGVLDTLKSQLNESEKQVEVLKGKLNELNAPGVGYTSGLDTEQGQKVAQGIEYAQQQMNILNAQQQSTENTSKKVSSNMGNNFKHAFDKIKHAGGKMVDGIKGFFSKIHGHAKDSADGMEKSFRKGFKMLLKYAIGVRSFYFLFRKIRTAAKESLTAMAAQFPEVNAQLSALKNSFIQLKGSVGTVAQPLLQVLAPALTSIINLLTQAATAVGNFLALLTGQKFIYKAQKGTTDFAGAQDKSTGATKKNTKALKENQKALANYDKLNIIDQNKDKSGGGGGGGGGASSPQYTFEKVPVDGSIKDFVDRLKKAWKKADLTEIGEELGTKLRNALSKINWTGIQTEAEKMGKRLGTLIAGFISVKGLAKKIGETIGQALNTLLLGLQSFIKNVPWKKFGTFLADMLSGAFTAKDKNGRTLIGNIVKTFVDILNAVIDTFVGFVGGMEDKWGEIGDEIAKWLDWAVKHIKIGEFAEGVGKLINGLVTLIKRSLGNKDTWIEAGKKIADAINRLFKTIEWKEMAQAISAIATGFLDLIETGLDNVKWEEIGKAIGEFLGNIEWGTILVKTVKIIIKAFWGAFKALITPSGSLQGDIIKAFLAALGTIFVAKKFMGLVGTIKGCFGSVIGQGVAEAGASSAVTSAATGTASGIGSGIINAFTSLKGKMTTQFSNSLSGVFNAVKSSPLLVAAVAAVGYEVGGIIGNALADNEGPLGDAFRQVVKDWAGLFGEDGTMMTEKQWQALKERAKAAREAVEKELEPINNKIKDINKSIDDSTKSTDNFNKKINEIDTGGKGVQTALKNFKELSSKTHLSAVETQTLKDASAKLAKTYPGLNKYIDKNTGILKINKGKLNDVIEKSKRHKKAVEAQKSAEELYNKQAPLKKALEDAQKAYDDAYKKMEDYKGIWKKTYDDWNKGLVDDATMAEVNKKMQGYANAVNSAYSALNKAKSAQQKNNEAIRVANNLMETAKVDASEMAAADDKLKDSLKNLNIPANEQKQIMKELKGALKEGKISWEQYKGIVDKNYKSVGSLKNELNKINQQHVSPTLNIKVTGKEEMNRVKEYFGQFKNSRITKTMALEIQAKFKDPHIKAAFKSGHFSPSDYVNSFKATGGIFTGSGWHPIEGYASGGNPKSGQFFMARENGIPELVGTIRNHTAVMNNNQIVASVAAGVYQAVAGVARAILPYVRLQTHAMVYLAQQGIQVPDMPNIAKGNVVPSNNQFLQSFAGNDNTKALTDIASTIKAMLDNQVHEPIIVQMPNGKVLAEAVWDEQEKKYKQARSSTLQISYA